MDFGPHRVPSHRHTWAGHAGHNKQRLRLRVCCRGRKCHYCWEPMHVISSSWFWREVLTLPIENSFLWFGTASFRLGQSPLAHSSSFPFLCLSPACSHEDITTHGRTVSSHSGPPTLFQPFAPLVVRIGLVVRTVLCTNQPWTHHWLSPRPGT